MKYSRITLLSFVIQGVGLWLFIHGFFPPRVSIPPSQDTFTSPSSRCIKNPSNSITRLVVMVIDGWRSDFLFSRPEQMPFLSTHGTAFECQLGYPTVTMPRLKALLGGIVPSYLDVALNLASKEFTEDNWLKRAVKDGKKAVFYGDDTWLNMFPNGIFEPRSEGTVSFFVTDYTEVDNNVTRHLNAEFGKEQIKDWNILILHYLGLDHIGHSLGDKTHLINVKLNEMDSIAKDIYQKLVQCVTKTWLHFFGYGAVTRRDAPQLIVTAPSPPRHRSAPKNETMFLLSIDSGDSENFAFVILGDHGMAEDGGHGGATYEERHVPVVFLRPKEKPKIAQQKYFKIDQLDLVPTISSLFGIQIPANNLGISFIDRLPSTSKDGNNLALWSLLQNGNQLRHLLMNAGDKINDAIVEVFDTCLAELSATSCNDKSTSGTTENLITRCYKTFKNLQEAFIDLSSEYKHDFLVFGLVFSLLATFISFSILRFDEGSFEQIIVCIQPILNFASSYVEEEQHVWNFLFSTAVALRIFQSRKSNSKWTKEGFSLIGILFIHRICETLKHNITVFLPADDQTIQTASNLLSIVILLALHSGTFWIRVILSISYFSDPFQIPYVWFSLHGCLLLTFYACLLSQILFAPISDTLLFWILSLASPSNKIILLLSAIMGHLIVQTKSKNSPAFFYLAIASSFYYTGNTHSLATLDLSSAYTRLPFYNPLFVGIQLFLVGYSGPIMLLILRLKQASFEHFPDHLLFYRSSSMFLALSTLFLMRHHLFVWSVFAPKLVFEIFHFCATAIFCLGLKLSSLKNFRVLTFYK